MRTLIDGYNLMHAVGLLSRRFGPDGFRKVRQRFLNDLADTLGPVEANQTTVVFDAATPPANAPGQSLHKGLTVIYSVGDESADARLEWLIARHSAPKSLTVVSSDRRVRDAASRRKAKVLTAEEFWTRIKDRKDRAPPHPAPPLTAEELARQHGPTAEEAAYWLDAFADLIDAPEARQALRPDDFAPTDDDIARIEREVEDEFRDDRPKRKRR